MFQTKRKGGWPKGRKRKPPDMSDLKPPKAPSTGYVFYLIDKRKHYKNLPFQEVRIVISFIIKKLKNLLDSSVIFYRLGDKTAWKRVDEIG